MTDNPRHAIIQHLVYHKWYKTETQPKWKTNINSYAIWFGAVFNELAE